MRALAEIASLDQGETICLPVVLTIGLSGVTLKLKTVKDPT
jgi:hypothetical protein